MCLGLSTLSDASIGKLLAHPRLVWKAMGSEDPEEDQWAQQQPGFFARLFGKKAPDPLPALELGEGEVVVSDLDKAWHGIHFLLTQTADAGEAPLNFICAGGRDVGDVDVGYGPARAFTSAEVRTLNQALAPLDAVFLKSRFDPGRMMELDIYPSIWDRPPGQDDTLGYCCEYFGVLKTFVADAARRNVGMLVYLC